MLLAELIAEGGSVLLAPADYAPFYRSLLAGRVARPRRPAHPRLFIWGPLEARLQQPDVVILGSLNEGVWPRPQEASPWLSRPMAAKLGLPAPERRIGLSAHDFAQALAAPTVYLSRAVKVDGVPTVPSRWLQRLNALVEAAKLKGRIAPKQPWARGRGSAMGPGLHAGRSTTSPSSRRGPAAQAERHARRATAWPILMPSSRAISWGSKR